MDDRRGTINVDASQLKEFIKNNYNVYARDVVVINGLTLPLVMSISMETNFIVSLGVDILYSGCDISEAIKVFNSNIKGIKEIWTNLDSSSRNMVNHRTPEKSTIQTR